MLIMDHPMMTRGNAHLKVVKLDIYRKITISWYNYSLYISQFKELRKTMSGNMI